METDQDLKQIKESFPEDSGSKTPTALLSHQQDVLSPYMQLKHENTELKKRMTVLLASSKELETENSNLMLQVKLLEEAAQRAASSKKLSETLIFHLKEESASMIKKLATKEESLALLMQEVKNKSTSLQQLEKDNKNVMDDLYVAQQKNECLEKCLQHKTQEKEEFVKILLSCEQDRCAMLTKIQKQGLELFQKEEELAATKENVPVEDSVNPPAQNNEIEIHPNIAVEMELAKVVRQKQTFLEAWKSSYLLYTRLLDNALQENEEVSASYREMLLKIHGENKTLKISLKAKEEEISRLNGNV